MNNPYEPPNASSPNHGHKQQLNVRHHVTRNVLSWTICLIGYCAVDFFYVHYGPASVRWAEILLIPAFAAGMLFANRGLFQQIESAVTRWIAIVAVSLAVMLISGYFLILFGIWFHLSIGGQL